METIRTAIIIALALCLAGAGGLVAKAAAGEGGVSVKLTDPNKPCYLECGLITGGITVVGYDGKEVKVEGKKRDTDEWVNWNEDEDKDRENAKQGLKRIPVSSTAFEVEEDDNHVTISAQSFSRAIDMVITVPVHTSLSLTTINGGDIKVSNVTGEIEAENINGDIELTGISGSVVAYVQNGDLDVEMKSVTPDKPMSFASFNGDVDVALPANVKATVKISTHTGDAYSDFDFEAIKRPTEVIEDNEDLVEGRYHVRIEDAFFGSINGGGPEFDFSTFNGDIYIRKGK